MELCLGACCCDWGKPSCSPAKTANGGGSSVVAELPMALTTPQMFLLYELFLRSFNGELKRPESWKRVLLMFLAKIPAPQRLVNFRGITLLEVIAKLCMAMLMLWAGTFPVPVHHKCAVIAAYSAGASAARVALILAILVRKRSE